MAETKHERVARMLRMELGEPGSTLPGENELAERFEVSRPTVRQALKALEDEGLIVSSPGQPRRVREFKRWPWDMVGWEQPAQHRDNIADAWAHSVRAQGGRPFSSTEVFTIPAPADVAKALRIEPGTMIQHRKRVRMIDDKPHQLSDSFFPPFVTEGNPLFEPKNDTAAPGGLLAASGFQQVRWHDSITARMPTADETHLLIMSPGTPLLVHVRVGYDSENRPLRYMVTRVAADQVEFTYDVPVELT